MREALVHAVEVAIYVHRRPRQDVHPRVQLLLDVVEVRLHQRFHHRDDQVHDAVVLFERVRQLVVVLLEFLLLEQHHLRRLRHLYPHALQIPRLAHELYDLLVEVHEKVPGLRVLHDERRLKPSLAALDRFHPRLKPERLERDQRLGDGVIRLHGAFAVLHLHDRLVRRELSHGLFDPPQELPGPHDVARDRRRVPRERRRVLGLFVNLLHRV
mmetsp:Transcript_3914/g.13590  ORF Transcript_3914/g.13590 Transcript_3914/m.13590 type:complete len:213 (+) Transcript_3914:4155-4793(+)